MGTLPHGVPPINSSSLTAADSCSPGMT